MNKMKNVRLVDTFCKGGLRFFIFSQEMPQNLKKLVFRPFWRPSWLKRKKNPIFSPPHAPPLFKSADITKFSLLLSHLNFLSLTHILSLSNFWLGRTDERTDERTDSATYRGGAHLKMFRVQKWLLLESWVFLVFYFLFSGCFSGYFQDVFYTLNSGFLSLLKDLQEFCKNISDNP